MNTRFKLIIISIEYLLNILHKHLYTINDETNKHLYILMHMNENKSVTKTTLKKYKEII